MTNEIEKNAQSNFEIDDLNLESIPKEIRLNFLRYLQIFGEFIPSLPMTRYEAGIPEDPTESSTQVEHNE